MKPTKLLGILILSGAVVLAVPVSARAHDGEHETPTDPDSNHEALHERLDDAHDKAHEQLRKEHQALHERLKNSDLSDQQKRRIHNAAHDKLQDKHQDIHQKLRRAHSAAHNNNPRPNPKPAAVRPNPAPARVARPATPPARRPVAVSSRQPAVGRR